MKRVFSFLGSFLICLYGVSALAATVIVPNIAGTREVNFGGDTLGAARRVQTVHHASQFVAAPIIITELRWRPNVGIGPFTTTVSNIQITLSTTVRNPGGLSSTFADNVGIDATQVFSGSATITATAPSGGPHPFELSIPLTTPFTYNPANGNLLVDVRNFSGSAAPGVGGESGSGQASRAEAFDPNATSASFTDSGADALEIVYNLANPLPSILTGPVTNSANGHVYYLLDTDTWADSEEAAQQLGGHLATINDTAEDAWVFSAFGNFGGTPRGLWIGLNDTNSESSFAWADGDLAAYRNWSPGEPNNFNNEDHVFIFPPQDIRAGTWNDAPGDSILATFAGPNYPSAFPVHGVVEVIPPTTPVLTVVVPNIAATRQLSYGGTVFRERARNQIVYHTSQFPAGNLLITELRWRPNIDIGPFTSAIPDIQINLSTTAKNPGALSSTLAENVGADDTIVFDGALNFSSTNPPGTNKLFEMVIPLTTPFVYNRASGNLLVETRNFVVNTTPGVGGESSSGQSSRAVALNVDSPTASFTDTGADAIEIVYAPAGSAPPYITGQPQSQSVLAGAGASFSVAAVGTSPLAYQWFLSATPLSGQTNSTLNLANVQATDAGDYTVVVANSFGSATSVVATLTVATLPPVLSGPVTNPANGHIYYLLSGANWTDSEARAVELGGHLVTINDAAEDAWVFNAFGNFGGIPRGLWIGLNDTNTEGTFVWVNGDLSAYRNWAGGEPNNFNNEDHAFIFAPQDTRAGTWNDAPAEVTLATFAGPNYPASFPLHGVVEIIPPYPLITQQPQSQSVLAGAGASFNVSATGSAPLSYQWFFGAGALSGQTNAALNLSGVQSSDAGNYSVVVANAYGAVTSSVAVLTVTVLPPTTTLIVPNIAGTREMNFGGATLREVSRGQTVHHASQFPAAPIIITELRWRPNIDVGPFSATVSNLQINLSTTVKNPNGLSGTFASNVGADDTMVFSGSITLTATTPVGAPQPFELSIPLATPFTYNPAAGNLLVDVRNFLGSSVSGVGGENNSGQSSRAVAVNNPNATTAGYQDTGADALQIVYAMIDTAPGISQQPQSQAVLAGTNVSFSVNAYGTQPLEYQWFFGAAPLGGQTNATLNLPNVQPANAGDYSVLVANAFGSVTSQVATLTVTLPPARVQVSSVTADALGPVTVPVVLVANGNEAAVGFTLQFNPARLTYTGVSLGSGAPGGSLLVNPAEAASGRVGIAVSLSSGTFAAGTQQVATVNFNIAPVVSNSVAAIVLGDTPIVREVANSLGQPLTAEFLAGAVSIVAVDYEGDVTPRPMGNRSLTVADWVQVGRFVAGLDTPAAGGEFQRADTAPRSNRGNGNLSATDWVQAGRYAAGLDPITAVGGPTSGGGSAVSAGKAASSGGAREFRVTNTNLTAGRIGTVDIELNAAGDESALTFSLSFDAAQMSFTGATLGTGAAGGTLNVNTSQAGGGKVGVALSMPIGTALTAGTQQVVRASFLLLQTASGDSPLTFGSTPVLQEVSDPLANALTAGYTDSLLKIEGPIPTLTILRNGDTVTLAWPSDITGYSVEESPTMLVPAAWNAVGAAPSVIGGSNVVVLPATNDVRFFRLVK